MSEVYTGVDGHSINVAFTIPTDGDDLAAASVDDAFQQTADNWAHAVAAYPDTYNGGNYAANSGAVQLGGQWSWSMPTGLVGITVSGTASAAGLVYVTQNGSAPGLSVIQAGAGGVATFVANSSATAVAITQSGSGIGLSVSGGNMVRAASADLPT